jgi:tRNA dimethylallyltransferase
MVGIPREMIDEMIARKTLIIIAGPTATGKTGASIELAKHMDIEIISADSRQIFKYLNIGTAKASKEEQAAVPHHFIDIVEPDELYSAGRFGDEAAQVCAEMFERGKIPCVVGGSGLYIKALVDGLFEEEKSPELMKIREDLNLEFNDYGIDPIFDRLIKVDQASANLYADKNPRRIIRAMEYYELNKQPISEAHCVKQTQRYFNPIYFAINYDRDKLYERINLRSELMWDGGLIEETKKVLEMGFERDCNSLNSPGYKEAIEFLDGKLNEKEALDRMKMMTRRYAKRQFTWFRKIENIEWIEGSSEELAEKIVREISRVFK